jgi:hypothetical protein
MWGELVANQRRTRLGFGAEGGISITLRADAEPVRGLNLA